MRWELWGYHCITTREAGGGVDDACTGLGDADSDEAGLAMEMESEIELAGSESRADVAPKDESAGIAVGLEAEIGRLIQELRIKMKAWHGGDPARREFWADVGRSDSNRLRTSANRQTVALRGVSEQVGEARTSG